MQRHLIYKCHKCQNTLLLSNKMLHDLRCTEENPATYEKILSQKKETNNNLSKSKSPLFGNSIRKSNADGTSSDIKKNIKSNGKEEFIETKYDVEGNIISRKRTENLDNNIKRAINFQEVSDSFENEEDDYSESNNDIDNISSDNPEIVQNNFYYAPTIDINNQQIIYTTSQPREIIYEAPAKYDPNITINEPIEETVINTNDGLNDIIINELIVGNIMKETNNNMRDNLNSGIYGNHDDISSYNNYEQENEIYIRNINRDINNSNYEINNNYIDFSMNNDDILKRTAES